MYVSLIVTYGLDNHLGLFNGLIQPNTAYLFKYFSIIYIPALITIILLFLLIFFITYKLSSENSLKILIATTLTLMTFNLFDISKNHKEIYYFEKDTLEKFERSTVILIFDEMSGLSSLASESHEGNQVNMNFIKLFNKFNFNYYPNIFSIYDNTVSSLSSLINFNTKLDTETRDESTIASKNYFTEYDVNQNKLFDKYQSISVIQNMHINFCNNTNVKSCYQYNPFDLDIINAKSNIIVVS